MPAEGGGSNLFRAETAVTNLDLRVDVADRMVRMSESEDIEVDRYNILDFGNLTCIRAGREIVVDGDYDRDIYMSEMRTMDNGHIKEEVRGPATEHFQVESEAIMAGGYTSLNMGACVRTLGMSDHLCWGGWVEADGARTDIAKVAFRVYFGLQYVAGTRVVRGRTYIDDFKLRNERFGTLSDQQANVTHTGSPGSGTTMET